MQDEVFAESDDAHEEWDAYHAADDYARTGDQDSDEFYNVGGPYQYAGKDFGTADDYDGWAA